jgi:hypothetical protein
MRNLGQLMLRGTGAGFGSLECRLVNRLNIASSPEYR